MHEKRGFFKFHLIRTCQSILRDKFLKLSPLNTIINTFLEHKLYSNLWIKSRPFCEKKHLKELKTIFRYIESFLRMISVYLKTPQTGINAPEAQQNYDEADTTYYSDHENRLFIFIGIYVSTKFTKAAEAQRYIKKKLSHNLTPFPLRLNFSTGAPLRRFLRFIIDIKSNTAAEAQRHIKNNLSSLYWSFFFAGVSLRLFLHLGPLRFSQGIPISTYIVAKVQGQWQKK